jgi:hypothetical protein
VWVVHDLISGTNSAPMFDRARAQRLAHGEQHVILSDNSAAGFFNHLAPLPGLGGAQRAVEQEVSRQLQAEVDRYIFEVVRECAWLRWELGVDG